MNYTIAKNTLSLPVIPLRGLVALPGVVLQFDVGREKSVKAVDAVMQKNQLVFLTAQTEVYIDDPAMEELYRVGTVARIKQVLKMPGENIRVLAEGLYRGYMVAGTAASPYLTADVGMLADDVSGLDPIRTEAYLRSLREAFDGYISLAPKVSGDVVMRVYAEDDPGKLCDYIAANTPLKYTDKQAVLECQRVMDRLQRLIVTLDRETEIWGLDREISEKLKEQLEQNQREYYMREQIKILQTELGEAENNSAAAEEYREAIDRLAVSDEIAELLYKEADRLAKMPFGSHEATVVRNYLDLCLALPYNVFTKDRLSLDRARRILDKDHYGLEKIKDRILEFLAVRRLAPDMRGQILCLVGPPGVGKTSIAQSVARALGRKFVRMSLGGVRDEAEIRGHRRTYIGAMPGRIISAIKTAGSMNPVILLDEIDKLGADYKGDPASALLEVLDPEQNKTFRDHFVEYEFDLSNVMFITTANTDETIPPALLDRMETLYLTSYTQLEKYHILKEHLLPKQMKRHALSRAMLSVKDDALREIISAYTREAGVRNLEREAATVCRKAAVHYLKTGKKSAVTKENLSAYLGPPKYLRELLPETDQVGIANGLAYTSVGGELLFVEVNVMPGSGKVELTGSLGDVMKESARAAMSYIRTRADALHIDPNFYNTKDIHIHVPEGAIPKDGPSAGVTIACALISELTGRPFRRDLAMTGEITLRGRVLPIGGLREKTMAAMKAGVKTVVLPRDNMADLAELSEQVRSALCFVPVSHMDEVLDTALLPLPAVAAADPAAPGRPMEASPTGDAPPASPFMA